MFKAFTRKTSAAVISLALGTALVAVPAAHATDTAVKETNQVDVTLPLACNLRVKSGNLLVRAMAEKVYNSADEAYKDFKLQFPVEAPTRVEPGAEFDYTILPTDVDIPASIKTGVLYPAEVGLKKVTQINLWFDLPENAEVKEIVTEGDASQFSITQENGRLHIKGSAKDTKPIEEWNEEKRDGVWLLGGLRAKKEGDKFVLHTPKIILKMKAADTAGESIALKINDLDANTFDPKLFAQLYAEPDVTYGAFLRCGLSEHVAATAGKNKSTPFPVVEVKEATPGAVDVMAKVKLLDEEGNPFQEGETVQLLVDGNPVKFTVEADGFITITDTQNPDEEKKAVEVAFEGGEPVSVKLNTAEGAPQAETTTLQKQKPQQTAGSSAGDIAWDKPQVWGSILAAIIALPVLGLLAKVITDFLGHPRF